jgi:hypothetical protein
MIGDGDAVGVASQILKHMFRTAEGRLGVHNPLLAEELPQEATELSGIGKVCQ